ncbi:hemerythrin domain-containing protein [Sulfurisphaera ohwakuensis]|uniref:Cation-binding protein n=1 Tax=Sulfurisphaera ohwakuensis TaxID=69656 RepID=A0A650CHQ4_SULOH|nr:hemerythrin domain-containing protein [Sulfurisphaera ohwakuensis]MBB5254817.1 hemerythrin superfamily protein [Sulfurisphaera ohwakuensis]QGR17309.1 cation-binding protein [Sulfurisphaera ohwakuensis]
MITDPISLLKFEHAILRVRFQMIKECLNIELGWNMLENTHYFIVNWHAKIEDKYVFPVLEKMGINVKPLSNDHLLIEKYGNSVLKEKRRDWAERYIRIVIDHNLNEEKIFPKEIEEHDILKDIIADMRNFSGYFEFTGLSEYDLYYSE